MTTTMTTPTTTYIAIDDPNIDIIEGSGMDIYDWQLLRSRALNYWKEQYITHGGTTRVYLTIPAHQYLPMDPHPLQLAMYEYWRRYELWEAGKEAIMKKYALNPSVLMNMRCPEIEYPASINNNDENGCRFYLRTGDDPLPIDYYCNY